MINVLRDKVSKNMNGCTVEFSILKVLAYSNLIDRKKFILKINGKVRR